MSTILLAGAWAVPQARAEGWEETGRLSDRRHSHTATLLQSGQVLVAGGAVRVGVGTDPLSSVEVYDPATGNWSMVGSLADARRDHTATLLPSGHVLVAGGRDSLYSVELYDPATGLWCSSEFECPPGWNSEIPQPARLKYPRRSHTATLLPSGHVLVAGGPRLETEVYDPATGIWSRVDPLANARYDHTATLLPSGQVLVAGGVSSGDALSSVELYDPATGSWSMVGSLTDARYDHTATLLPSGQVLVAGGRGGDRLGSAELYDPATGNWTSSNDTLPAACAPGAPPHPEAPCPLADARREHTATLLPSGQVLVAGGFEQLPSGAGVPLDAELYDPATGSWSTVEPLAYALTDHTATLLPSGQVLVAGGWGSSDASSIAEVYDPATGTWSTVEEELDEGRECHTATLLPSGQVLVAGGLTSGHKSCGFPLPGGVPNLLSSDFLSSVELYDPATDTWTSSNPTAAGVCDEPAVGPHPEAPCPLADARAEHTATLLLSGQVLVAGGHGTDPLDVDCDDDPTTIDDNICDEIELDTVELYEPATGIWRTVDPLNEARADHTATLLPSGKVLVAGGGVGCCGRLSSAEVYDPASESWSTVDVGSLLDARERHTATLLPSGQVLVAGGFGCCSLLLSAEVYDPATGTWSTVGSLTVGRAFHTATLLPSGQVLVAGGSGDSEHLSSAELYDPTTGTWTLVPDSLEDARQDHTATLLPSGRVLAAGGVNALGRLLSAEVYHPVRARRGPVVTKFLPDPIDYFSEIEITGTGFGGDSEASGGGTNNSTVNYPLVQLRALEGDAQGWLSLEMPIFCPANPDADHPLGFCSTGSCSGSGDPCAVTSECPLDETCELQDATLRISGMPPIFDPGWHMLTVVTAGVPSESKLVELVCSDEIISGQPADAVGVPIGGTATFSVETRGGRFFQWQKFLPEAPDADPEGYVDIEGATGARYATPLVGAEDSGSLFRVIADSGCRKQKSEPATLVVFDEEDPTGEVVSPRGGELWLLSEEGLPNIETVSWTMSDNIRICQVRVSLLVSGDSGVTYDELESNELPSSFGPGGACSHPGEGTTALQYTVPEAPPSGTRGSLYKIRLEIRDHTSDPEDNPAPEDDVEGNGLIFVDGGPFFIVEPDDSVATLILAHPARMAALDGADTSELETQLGNLAAQQRVAGAIVDLAEHSDLASLYAAWDGCLAQGLPDTGCNAEANKVLFATGGVQDVILNRLAAFPEVKYLVLVGDDRIVPMARLDDGTALYPETNYPGSSDLTSGGTTVGLALSQGLFLSDDPLALAADVDPGDLGTALFIPDLIVGRLVETPAEIINTISTFISKGGLLELGDLDPANGHKVQVTGYDFLTDSAVRVRERWKNVLCEDPDDDFDLEPVDGELIDDGPSSWSEVDLKTHLCGNGGDPYGVLNLNGHATHYQEGTPGTGAFDIQGLDAAEIASDFLCSGDPLDLAGAVVYAVGCHGGLPVAGSQAAGDHPLDLPQALMGRGVVAYIANTGYGWGLESGSGYGERLIELFTDELTRPGTVVVGDAVKRSKQRYKLEGVQTDPYDLKSSMQWTFFGLPMYAVETGITGCNPAAPPPPQPLMGPPPGLEELPAVEDFAGVRVERRFGDALGGGLKAAPPPFVTRLELQFDFSAEGIYVKRGAAGDNLGEAPGCADPVDCPPGCADSEGCYYELNGLRTGVTDLPIQPYFVFDSRLAGTSQHGVLWKGGVYDEERGWKPVIGELFSNGGDGSDHGVAPRHVIIHPAGQRIGRDQDSDTCRPSDLELNSLTLPAGELLVDADSPDLGNSELYDIQRIYRRVDLDLFYYNNTIDGDGNCDRSGPSGLADGGGPFDGAYHQLVGTTLDWRVPVEDEAGIWRVLVVYNDGTTQNVDGVEQGEWKPVELEYEDGTWRESLPIADGQRITYLIQAVDNRGNVTWLDFAVADQPSSGAALSVPLPVDVEIDLEGSPCVPADTVLCLDHRFSVEVEWQDFLGNTGPGFVRPLTEDTGAFWFFDQENLELMVKVIDACGLAGFHNFWVFAGGLTNVEVLVRVTDTRSDEVREYWNLLGSAFQPIQDTGHFRTCP